MQQIKKTRTDHNTKNGTYFRMQNTSAESQICLLKNKQNTDTSNAALQNTITETAGKLKLVHRK